MNSQNAYPLSWPQSWPRAKFRQDAHFSTKGASGMRPKTMAESVDALYHELGLLQAANVVVSTNVKLTLDGTPRSGQPTVRDPGAAVYFTLKDQKRVLAVDKWRRVEDNLYAIAKHVESMRGQGRWGCGSVQQAFAGYTALPPSGASAGASWWNVLGCAHDAPLDVVKAAYRAKAAHYHPDNRETGNSDMMVLVNAAWDQARAAFEPKEAS